VAINDSGEVVGSSDTKAGSSSFLFNASDQKMAALSPTIGALGINDSGQIAGLCNDLPAAPELFACVASSNGTITELGDSLPPAFGNSPFECLEAVAINNNGQALAYCSGPGIPEDGAVVWTNGTPTVPCTFSTDAHPTAMNNNGQVVGTVYTSTGGEDGWLCSNGTLTDLGPSLFPAAINDSGVIVGGPLIDSGGTVQNLNTLIPAGSPYQIDSATGINDNGQIVANAEDTATGQTHALLLTPR
jgi:probable HAF family extracellular repeat protein